MHESKTTPRTLRELLAREPEKAELVPGGQCSPLGGCYSAGFNHIPELGEYWEMQEDANSRIFIKYYKDFNFDYRRFWRLASVWLDDKPVMVIQNAGREGDDYCGRFIVDIVAYEEMLRYLGARLVLNMTDAHKKDVVGLDDAPKNLTEFYWESLDGIFSR